MQTADVPSDLTLTVGEAREVVLPGLGTAGYRWEEELAGGDGVVVTTWRRGVAADEPQGRPIGASAPERLTITAAAPGHVTVHLAQRRPWEDGPPRAAHTIEVEVVAS